jgi:hypothetical protein
MKIQHWKIVSLFALKKLIASRDLTCGQSITRTAPSVKIP